DIKLIFDFCVEAHCFEDIYAKVLSVDEKDGIPVHQLQITSSQMARVRWVKFTWPHLEGPAAQQITPVVVISLLGILRADCIAVKSVIPARSRGQK
ncbi:MAG: hypothetical protein P8017_13265, partial [Deltaproteobacteria bacterium]